MSNIALLAVAAQFPPGSFRNWDTPVSEHQWVHSVVLLRAVTLNSSGWNWTGCFATTVKSGIENFVNTKHFTSVLNNTATFEIQGFVENAPKSHGFS